MRATLVAFFVFVVVGGLFGCDRGPSKSAPSASSSASAVASESAAPIQPAPWANGKTACQLIQATWMPDGFVGVSPAGSASAAALNAQMNDAVQTIRITYTGKQIKMKAGSQISMSDYSVMKDSATTCTLRNGEDTVVVTMLDLDHLVTDRTTNPYAAKMKMKRIDDDTFAPKK